MIGAPLLREGSPIGVFGLSRRSVRPFTDKQMELLTTFADQAVIAIENARLFEEVQARTAELQQSLTQQTATADVLKVISRSALDLQRVLDTLVESAARLCEAKDAAIFQVDGDRLRMVAHHGSIPMPGPVWVHTVPLVRGLVSGRAVIDQRPIHVTDMQSEADEYQESREFALRLGFRTILGIPLMRSGEAIGAILIRRTEVRRFSERHIALLETFADQAVIAIDNARLFGEVQARTKELTRAVEEMRALSEVGQTVSSTLDRSKVLQTVVEQASAMAYATGGAIYVFDKEKGEFHLEASHNMSAEHIARVRSQPIRLGDPVVGECAGRRCRWRTCGRCPRRRCSMCWFGSVYGQFWPCHCCTRTKSSARSSCAATSRAGSRPRSCGCSKPSPHSRRSPCATPACSTRSRRRGASSRSPASTSRSSSPT